METKKILEKVYDISLKVGTTSIPLSKTIKNVIVIFDSQLSFKEYVTDNCKKSLFQLCCHSAIQKYLTKDTTIQLIHSFIISGLDYYNKIYYNRPENLANNIQKIRN